MPSTKDELVEQLTEKIHLKIANGEYPPGARLRQEALADEFSVSRTPIREALRRLEVQGAVIHHANRGAIVRSADLREIREAYEVRAELEGLAIELAVKWITDDQIERMKRAQVRMVRAFNKPIPKSGKLAKGAPNWVEANEEFHSIVLEASGNRRLRQIIQNLHLGFIRKVMLSAVAMQGRQMRENIAQHEIILETLERHDATEARRLMRHHILRSGELLVAWLESQASDEP
jgi:DNA-binding GntR family transcriptional regulator